jgi:hypothetical protein
MLRVSFWPLLLAQLFWPRSGIRAVLIKRTESQVYTKTTGNHTDQHRMKCALEAS